MRWKYPVNPVLLQANDQMCVVFYSFLKWSTAKNLGWDVPLFAQANVWRKEPEAKNPKSVARNPKSGTWIYSGLSSERKRGNLWQKDVCAIFSMSILLQDAAERLEWLQTSGSKIVQSGVFVAVFLSHVRLDVTKGHSFLCVFSKCVLLWFCARGPSTVQGWDAGSSVVFAWVLVCDVMALPSMLWFSLFLAIKAAVDQLSACLSVRFSSFDVLEL